MKKRANVSKLQFNRETLRSLTPEEAGRIAGGGTTEGSGTTCMNGSCGGCTAYWTSCGCGSCDCP